MDTLTYNLYHWLDGMGLEESNLKQTTTIVMAAGAVIAAVIIFRLVRGPLAKLISRFAIRTPTVWDDRLLSKSMMSYIAWLVAVIWLVVCSHSVLILYPTWLPWADKISKTLITASVFAFFSKAVGVVYNGLRHDNVDLEGLSVLRNLVISIAGAICMLLIISILTGRNLVYIFSGLGAMAAVLTLIFKDSILGMVAGIRLVSNKMIKHNDWIIMDSHKVNGRVEDVRLSAVKVRNWDNSVSTIPPYALISEGFQNMEQMLNQGTRRIERSLRIDIHSVRMMSPEELERFRGEEWTMNLRLDREQPNILLWRRWLRHYIATDPLTVPYPRCMVRELPAGSEGIPVEVHFFVKCLDWEEFEELQADITDHILISMQRFGLRPFQFSALPEKKTTAS